LPLQAEATAAQTIAPMQTATPAQSLAPVEAAMPPETDIVILDDEENEAATLLSPTTTVIEDAGDALAYVSALAGASIFTGDSSFKDARGGSGSRRR
jgi:hypothetical protein